jgi:hypothetical protein
MSTTPSPYPDTPSDASKRAGESPKRAPRLGRYTMSETWQTHVILSLSRPDGSVFVIDYLLDPFGDGRVVAHLSADEPAENARIVCELYLADQSRGRCQRLLPEDLKRTQHVDQPPRPDMTMPPPFDAGGYEYCVRELDAGMTVPVLRWTRSQNCGREEQAEVVTLREVIAHLQDYEPARTITRDILAAREGDRGISTHQLRQELERLDCSAIVLNRGLREAVQRKVARGLLNQSQIAMRCGRTKQDRRGNRSGETSWLARRIGQLPESGEKKPTPWIHSDVLALITRQGLGASPHEVEL